MKIILKIAELLGERLRQTNEQLASTDSKLKEILKTKSLQKRSKYEKLALQNKKNLYLKKSKSKILLKTILVPTDFSAGANKALQYALTFAKQFDAKIELMHVVEPMLFPSDSVFNQPVIQPIFPSIDLEQRKIDEEKLKSIVVEIKRIF